MQGINAAFGDFSFDGGRGPDRVPRKSFPPPPWPWSGPLACGSSYMRPVAAPDIANPPSARSATASMAAPATGAAVNPYGEIVIDPSFLAEMKPASPAENLSPLASLDAVPPASPRRSRCRASTPFRPSLPRASRKPRSSCRRRSPILRISVRAPPCRRLGLLNSPRPRRRAIWYNPTARPFAPPLRPTIAIFCRSFSGWGCRPRPPQRRGPPSHRRPPLRRGPLSYPVPRPRPGSPWPARRRKAEARAGRLARRVSAAIRSVCSRRGL